MTNISRQIFDGAKYTISFSMIQYMLFIVTQVILARLISPELFGEFAIIAIYVMFFFTLSNFNSDKFIIISNKFDSHKFSTIVKFDFIISLINYLFFFIIIYNQILPNIDYQYKNHILLFGLIIFYHPLSRKKALLEKELDFFSARYPATISTLIASIFSIFLAFKGYPILSLILWRLLQYLCESIILTFIKKVESGNKKSGEIKKLIKYSGPLLISNIIIYFYWNIDYLIVEKLLGKEQLGFYWLAFQLGLFILRIKDSIINVVLPVYADTKNKSLINKNFNQLSSLVFRTFAIIFIVFLFYGKSIFIYVFGYKWLPAYYPFLITIILSMIRSFTSFFEPILLINNKTNYKLYLAILNAILVPISVYYLVNLIGINGAPLGVLLSNIVSSSLLIFLTKDLVKIDFNKIITPILILIFITLTFYLYELNWLLKIFILLLLISFEILNARSKQKSEK